MTHLSEESLVLHYYGELGDDQAARHLEECAECRAVSQNIRQSLDLLRGDDVPEPNPDFEARLWQRLQPQMSSRRPALRGIATLGLAASLLAGAFLAGRWTRPDPAPTAEAPARNPVLLNAVSHHLDRSHLLLVELANGRTQAAAERDDLRDLLDANRLYRQSASRAGETALSELLEELEQLLMEIEHLTPERHAEAAAELRNVLFKVRVLGTQLRERDKRMEDEL